LENGAGLVIARPGLGREAFDLPVRRVGQPGEDVAQIRIMIEATTTTAFDDGVQDGATLPSLGLPDKQPVLFAEACCGILAKVLVDLNATLAEVNAQEGFATWMHGTKII
jgi:hypothetical protein